MSDRDETAFEVQERIELAEMRTRALSKHSTAPDPIRARLDEDEVAPGIPYSAALQAWNEASDDTTLGEIRRRAAEIAALGEPR